MSTEVRIPAFGMSASEGTVAEWLADDGAQVEKGQPLYNLELDKSVQEIEAPASGTLSIKVAAGEVLEIGALIATID
jgi:pyruvate/2-oxoglutarate dehydrogenase complex dihydrolipoamide acyltransferase (E2) component